MCLLLCVELMDRGKRNSSSCFKRGCVDGNVLPEALWLV